MTVIYLAVVFIRFNQPHSFGYVLVIPTNCSDHIRVAVHSSFCGISCDGSVLDYHGIDANGVLEHDTGELSLRDG